MKNNQKERCEYKLVRKMKLLNQTSILNILTNQKTIHAKKKKKNLNAIEPLQQSFHQTKN